MNGQKIVARLRRNSLEDSHEIFLTAKENTCPGIIISTEVDINDQPK
jgi:hypothetical protein